MRLKSLLPTSLRSALRALEKTVVYFLRRQRIRIPVALNRPIKIIVGAAMTRQAGWYSTNEQWLDITQSEDWLRIFRGKALLSHVLAEHVFEHLTADEARLALHLLAQHMTPGGRIRIAVPDGYHPDSIYIKHVGIAGIGADASDHKQLLNSDTLAQLLRDGGFSTEVMEGYLNTGELIHKPLEEDLGRVTRSRSTPHAIADEAGWAFVDAQTSLVIDGTKPA